MKTYPITDHVPESELLAITQAGAERWLTSHGWTRESPDRYPHWWSAPGRLDDTVVLPKEGTTDRIGLRALGRRQLERDMFDLQLYGPGSACGHGVSHVAGQVRISRAKRLHRAAIRAWHRVMTAQAIRRYGVPF